MLCNGGDGSGPWTQEAAEPTPQGDQGDRCNPMRDSLFCPAGRCPAVDHAGNCGWADPSGSRRLYYRQYDLKRNEKNEIKPRLVKEWYIPKATAEYVAKMEDVLNVYQRQYSKSNPGDNYSSALHGSCQYQARRNCNYRPDGVLALQRTYCILNKPL